MSGPEHAGRAVLDLGNVQHVAAARPHETVCGVEWVTFDLHWAETTRVHCIACLALAPLTTKPAS